MNKSSLILLVLILLVSANSAQTQTFVVYDEAQYINTDTGNFDGALSGSDTTVQAALDTLDDAVSGGSCFELDGNSDLQPVSSTCSSGSNFEEDGNGDLQPQA